MRLSGPHLPSNMFSIPRQSCVRLGEEKLPPTQHMAGPPTETPCARLRGGTCHQTDLRPFACWDKKPSYFRKKKGGAGWGKKEEKEPECVNHTHHYHNRLRSWLVDDWFTSSCCKPRRERRWKSPYLFVRTAGGSGRYMGGCSLPATGAPAATPISSWIDPHDRSVPPVVFSSQTRISRARNQDSSLLAKGRCCGVDGTSGNTSRWNADEFLAPSCVTAACGAGPWRSKVVPNSQHT